MIVSSFYNVCYFITFNGNQLNLKRKSTELVHFIVLFLFNIKYFAVFSIFIMKNTLFGERNINKKIKQKEIVNLKSFSITIG